MRRFLIGGALGGLAIAGSIAWNGPIIPHPNPPAAPPAMSAPDAVRLAKQATFGPNDALVAHISQLGTTAWLDEQFSATGSSYVNLAARRVPGNYCNALAGQDLTNCQRDYFAATPVQMRFYADAIGADDQLRQRVAFALGQILVASAVEVNSTAGVASYNQIFLDNAFGNYRDIVKAVTLHPFMGNYLDMADSNKSAPNENYARELMQLFSLGVSALNPDGTVQRDASGDAIATYTATDVHEVARALTGWTYARLNGAAITDNNQLDYASPMIMVPTRYDTAAKTFLGRSVPAGASQAASVDTVVDAVFNHPNTAPFVSKALIQQLVTSNPSPAYVRRVAAVFSDNGQGIRGDMRAVVRAILTDDAARGDVRNGTKDGKVKEPVLMLTSLMRLIGVSTDGYAFVTRDANMGEAPFRSPSVFNFYPPDYPLAQSPGLVSPQSKLLSTSQIIARHNVAYDWTVSGDGNRSEYAVQVNIPGATGTQPNWVPWQTLTTVSVDDMIERINLLALNNTMTAAQKASIKAAVLAVTNADPATQARKRAQTALYIVASSPQFQVDR